MTENYPFLIIYKSEFLDGDEIKLSCTGTVFSSSLLAGDEFAQARLNVQYKNTANTECFYMPIAAQARTDAKSCLENMRAMHGILLIVVLGTFSPRLKSFSIVVVGVPTVPLRCRHPLLATLGPLTPLTIWGVRASQMMRPVNKV